MWWDEEEGIQWRLEEDKARSRQQLNFENLWRTMLALEEGEEVLCILQTADNVLLLAARGGGCASIGYNGVDGQAGSSGTNSVRKESSQFEKEAQVGSQVNTTVRVVTTWRSGSGLV